MKVSKNTNKMLSRLLIVVLVAAIALTLIGCQTDRNAGTDEEKTITVEVVGKEGTTTTFTITTTAATLRAALEEKNLIAGDEGQFGLYVKVVNGETADYDVDQSYWYFYKGDEPLMTSVDDTYIADGDEYRIVYTK